MKGKNHLRMGACTVGCVAATGLVPFTSAPAAVAVGIGLFLFGKVAPDLDHKSSSITRSWGPVTWVLSRWVIRPAAWAAYRGWRGPGDPPKPRIHRGFTHTWPGAFLAGALGTLVILTGPTPTAVFLGLAIGGAARVHDRGLQVYGAATGAALGYLAWPQVLVAAPWLWFVLAAGCFAHAVDDCVTTSGAPLRFPQLDRRTGKRWTMVGPPEWMRFDTGSGFETAVVWAAMIATTGLLYFVFLAPVVGPVLQEAFG